MKEFENGAPRYLTPEQYAAQNPGELVAAAVKSLDEADRAREELQREQLARPLGANAITEVPHVESTPAPQPESQPLITADDVPR